MTHARSTKPTSAKARDVVGLLRERIRTGPWGPGMRIPTKIELSRELGASVGTVQKALDDLTAHGFLRSRGCLGTFVVEQPPHLFRIGLAVGLPRGASIWHDLLGALAEKLAQAEHRWLHVYYGCSRDHGVMSPALQELEDDLNHARVAGVILAGDPEALAGTATLERPGLARAVIGPPFPSRRFPGMKWQPAYPRAMQYFQAQGRKRFSIIATAHHSAEDLEPILQCARDHGLQTSPAWVHCLLENFAYPAQSLVQLLMSLPSNKRPDALYIHDDHLLRDATQGLADSGVRVPAEITVIGHANFPATQPTAVPVIYLGYDMGAVMRAALGIIDQQLAGRKVPELTLVNPVFDYELPTAFEVKSHC